MRVSSIAGVEASFKSTGNNNEYLFKKISVPVPGEDLHLEGLLCTPRGRSGYFYTGVTKKERILLHFTAGHLRSDMATLTRNNYHVSVPFVIARDGTIYQLFSSKFWSGNIGKGIGNAGNAEDKKTISIEISNYGFLTEKNGNLETIYSRLPGPNGPGPVDVYCSANERDAYTTIATPFRSQTKFASFTSQQYESLIVLLRYLTATYNIPREFMPDNLRFQATDQVLRFQGIVSHVNYRESGKWDIGPAFDWARVVAGVQASAFQVAAPATRSVVASIPGFSNEAVDENAAVNGTATTRDASATDVITSERSIEELVTGTDESTITGSETENPDDMPLSLHQPGSTIHAVFVGINAYPRIPLNGCVKDVMDMDRFLREMLKQQDQVTYSPLYFVAPHSSDNSFIQYKT
ncbi:MAG: N-acetylmuramoyl-L-alanine amidase, partial [Chitinophagaceae bacterium]